MPSPPPHAHEARPRIRIFIFGMADPRPGLAALGATGLQPRITVLWHAHGAPAVAQGARALGEEMLAHGGCAAFAWEPLEAGQDWRQAVNEGVAGMEGEGGGACGPEFLLLLSAAVLPEAGCLGALASRLTAAPGLAGVGPLLLSPEGALTPRRVRHMGWVFDCRRQLHALYEGLPAAHELTRRRRLFQAALEDALMVRLDDFRSAGGFAPGLGDLAPLDLCFRLGGGRAAFSIEPAAVATLGDIHAGWRTAAYWNSLVQRGRIPPDAGHPDYPRHAQADGLEYGLTAWLTEGPRLPEAEPAGESWTAAWLRWRHDPQPANLLHLLARSGAGELRRIMGHCRAFPAMLPHALAWYAAQARHLEVFAKEEDLPHLREEAARWRKGHSRFHHRQLRPGMRALADAGIWACSLDAAPSSYDAWMELREPAQRPGRVKTGKDWPEIALLMPVWNPRPDHLAAALDSVLGQSYGRWQLCVADDASTDPEIPRLLRTYAGKDPRIRLVRREANGHISRATNSALALADAPWTAFFDHDDLLAPTALEETAAVIAGRPDVRFVYTDEDRIDDDGVRRTPVFKAGFDCDLPTVGHLNTYATELVRAVGGLRTGLEGSQDLDLKLRITERLEPAQVAHIPRVLYHWRIHEGSTAGSITSKPYVLRATRRALEESARRRGQTVEGAATCRNNFFTLILGVPAGLRCTVILLADASCAGLAPAPALLDALAGLAARMRVEICWQPLTAACPKPAGWARERLPLPRLLPVAGPHWADACMAASRHARGDLLLFLHAGLSPAAGCRPEQLVIQALRPDLALVGGLVWKRGRLWNGGFAPDVTGLPFPLLRGAARDDLTTHCWGQFLLTRHTLGVGWECMACRRELLLDATALDARMGSLAGVDYSLRQEAAGRFTLVSPWGQWELPQHGEADAEPGLSASEAADRFRARWGGTVRHHPLRNANLCAAPDYGWRLILEDGAETAP